MSGVKKPDSAWLKNFMRSANSLLADQSEHGYKVQGFLMTESVYDRLSNELGYEPTDVLGYVIEIIDPSEKIEGDVVMLKGQLLN